MKLKQSIIDQINNVESRRRISEELGIGDQMFYKHLKANEPNGRLTLLVALKAIAKETGQTIDAIIEEEPVTETQS